MEVPLVDCAIDLCDFLLDKTMHSCCW